MGCNCKNDKKDTDSNNGEVSKVELKNNIGKYTLKIIAFFIMLLLLPVIIVLIIWFIFNTLVLSKDVDIKPLLLMMGNKFSGNNGHPNDEDDYDDDDYDEDDFIAVNVEDITKRTE